MRQCSGSCAQPNPLINNRMSTGRTDDRAGQLRAARTSSVLVTVASRRSMVAT